MFAVIIAMAFSLGGILIGREFFVRGKYAIGLLGALPGVLVLTLILLLEAR